MSSRPKRTRISYFALLARTTYAIFPQEKSHDVDQRHESRQEIRGSEVEGSAVLPRNRSPPKDLIGKLSVAPLCSLCPPPSPGAPLRDSVRGKETMSEAPPQPFVFGPPIVISSDGAQSGQAQLADQVFRWGPVAGGRTADPSTSLRFGRDDKGRVVAYLESCDRDVWSSGGTVV